MSIVTITLPEPLAERVREAATREGISADGLALRLLDSSLASSKDQATLDLLRSWDQEDATSDPVELEERRREFDEFRRSMNESCGRVIYP